MRKGLKDGLITVAAVGGVGVAGVFAMRALRRPDPPPETREDRGQQVPDRRDEVPKTKGGKVAYAVSGIASTLAGVFG